MNFKFLSFSTLVIAILVLTSCGRDNGGQLVGVKDRPSWKGINPYGMVYVPSGFLHIGQGDQDIFNSHIQKPKAISIQGFYMDETEISNNEYRQFINYVKDSIAHTIMGDFIEDDFGNEQLDWDYELDYADETLDEMFYQGDMVLDGNYREFDARQFIYGYSWVDWKKARGGNYGSRAQLIEKEEVLIYPDTLCWVKDFAYEMNEPLARNYFSHPAYDDYPVVGINWKQTQAFSHWRTKMWDKNAEVNTEAFRLPTEFEWEYAARGGHDRTPYPWGGYYIRNAKGCLLANFKPGRGNYAEDGGLTTTPVDGYFPNDYGLYNMAGNVAEWTETAYYDHAYDIVGDLNPDIKYNAQDDDPEVYKRKVVRGGSWKDISYYLQTGTRTYEYQDTAKSYIGFRCALTFMGRSLNDAR